MVSKFIFAALFLCDVIFGSGNGDSKEVYKLHIKQFEEAVKDDKNVKPYIIDLFQYHVPNADAFSHQRNHAETKEFMECFGELSPHTDKMWRAFKRHWSVTDDNDWLIIKAVKGLRLLLCLNTETFLEYKQEAQDWYAAIKADMGSESVSQGNDCQKQTAKVVQGMIDGLKGVYNYDSQKEALENLYSIAAFYCNINDKNDKFKDVKTNDVTLILNAMNEMLSEFGQRLKEELLDETKKIESYDQCKTMAEDMALNYGFDETFHKYIFVRKYHVIALMENLYELECEETYGKSEL